MDKAAAVVQSLKEGGEGEEGVDAAELERLSKLL